MIKQVLKLCRQFKQQAGCEPRWLFVGKDVYWFLKAGDNSFLVGQTYGFPEFQLNLVVHPNLAPDELIISHLNPDKDEEDKEDDDESEL